MSTHRTFDAICVVVLLLTLLITVLFMNGEAYGILSGMRSPLRKTTKTEPGIPRAQRESH